MSGITGVIINKNLESSVTSTLVTSLSMLQHRGQNGCGVAVSDNDRITYQKQKGLISNVFSSDVVSKINGYYGIGQCHNNDFYNKLGSEPQPAYCNMPFGLSAVMSGAINNREQLRKDLAKCLRCINSFDDADYLVNVFAEGLLESIKDNGVPIVTKDHVFAAVNKIYKECKGGYAAVILINGVGLVAFKDPHGIRPLVYGELRSESGSLDGICISTESISITSIDYSIIRDLNCAETLFVDKDMNVYIDESRTYAKEFTPCIYEYVFYALPNSVINGISVYQARENMGKMLAEQIKNTYIDYEGEQKRLSDVITHIMPIPETSRHTACAISHLLNIPYCEGISKNRYIARTFRMPGQTDRIEAMKIKHSAIPVALKDQNILLVDDSMIRGTTASIVIDTIREAGVKHIYYASACPPIKYNTKYGLNLPQSDEFICNNKSLEEVKQTVGADIVIFQTLEGLIQACETCPNSCPFKIHRFETSVFDGKFITDEDKN
ncbi:hypothetical protein WA158_003300 [Blastocystis sp. Blastoise]